MIIEFNKVYHFECNASFGSLSQEKINKLFMDGRKASGFLELQLEEWFDGLVFEDGKGYDHRHVKMNFKTDAKCFTKHGANFSPSKMLGFGREVNEEELWKHAMSMIYTFCDIVDFPKVRVIFKPGCDLTQYPKGKIPFKHRNILFSCEKVI